MRILTEMVLYSHPLVEDSISLKYKELLLEGKFQDAKD